MRIADTAAYKYALACTDESNDKVGRYIKKQAVKWLEIADGKSDIAYVSGKEWGRINKFIESDDNMQFIMSEKSARKIIDRLR